MDWADACSLGRALSLNRYFLLILDKGTEYWATYPRKTRGTGTPVEFLKQYITTTGRTPRYLRIDNAKEFTSQEMVDFCSENDIILRLQRKTRCLLACLDVRLREGSGACGRTAQPRVFHSAFGDGRARRPGTVGVLGWLQRTEGLP